MLESKRAGERSERKKRERERLTGGRETAKADLERHTQLERV